MTRINVVPPSELVREHLVAEYSELPRAFTLVKAAQERGLAPTAVGIPTAYTLGTGHVKFFYDKCLFLLRRQQSLIREMQSRGYNPKFDNPDGLIVGLDQHWLNDWEPDSMALYLNRLRIRERLNKMGKTPQVEVSK